MLPSRITAPSIYISRNIFFAVTTRRHENKSEEKKDEKTNESTIEEPN